MAQSQHTIPTEHLSPNASISIGLLLPDNSYKDVVAAAELAIENANRSGGYKNHEFELVVRTAEGFWGAGSKESVSLVYEDHVRAIVGYLDGRNGHLAEQVATKSHLTYIETLATEPTLSQAFVPWFMRVVPNDNQQSAAILKQILQEDGNGKIGILSTDTYDCRYAVRSLTQAIARENKIAPLILEPDTSFMHQRKIIEQILSAQIEHLVIPYDADYLQDLIIKLGLLKPDLKIYGTLHFTMGVEKRSSGWPPYEGLYIIRPAVDRQLYPSLPDTRSAYLYDAVQLVINAIHMAGTERETITHYISDSKYSGGVTGEFSFDELGNRQIAVPLMHIENGIPQALTPH